MQIARSEIEEVLRSGLFDVEYYRSSTNIVGEDKELIEHYLTDGERLGRWPNKFFNPYQYLAINPDVAQAEAGPLMHYIRYGVKENRSHTISSPQSADLSEQYRLINLRLLDISNALEGFEQKFGNQTVSIASSNKPNIFNTLTRIRSKIVEAGSLRNYILTYYYQHERYCYRSEFTRNKWQSRLSYTCLIRLVAKQIVKDATAGKGIYKFNDKLRLRGSVPRIMHFIPNVFLGGSTQLIKDIYDAHSDKFEMHIATSAFPREGKHEGVIIHDLSGPISVESVENLLNLFGADLVHVHYWGDVDYSWYDKIFKASSSLNLPVIQNINTPVAPYRSTCIHRNIFVSEYVRRTYADQDDDTEFNVIHPGIDLKLFDKLPSYSEAAFNSVGMVYRLEDDKLNQRTIELFVAIVKKRPSTRVFIIGGGSLYKQFVAYVCKHGVRDNFVFTGYVDYSNLPNYYKQFSVFITPVWKESFGQVAPFAMAMGRAVAGFDIGAIHEILGGAEFLGKGIDDTSDIIVSLLNDRDRLASVGASNRERARMLFDVKKMTDQYKDIYQELYNRRRIGYLPTLENSVK